MNKVILIGNVGQEPRVNETLNGQPVANFSMATNENFNDASGNRVQKETWHNVVAWNGLSKVVENYLTVGKQVCVEGKIQNREYSDNEGIKRRVSEIIALRIELLGAPPAAKAA